jgi:hypothetical protein
LSAPFNPLFNGLKDIKGDNALQFEFNSERSGWHYGWTSNRRTKDSEHTFRIFFFSNFGEESLCIGVFETPSFSIHSRRRARY